MLLWQVTCWKPHVPGLSYLMPTTAHFVAYCDHQWHLRSLCVTCFVISNLDEKFLLLFYHQPTSEQRNLFHHNDKALNYFAAQCFSKGFNSQESGLGAEAASWFKDAHVPFNSVLGYLSPEKFPRRMLFPIIFLLLMLIFDTDTGMFACHLKNHICLSLWCRWNCLWVARVWSRPNQIAL